MEVVALLIQIGEGKKFKFCLVFWDASAFVWVSVKET